MSKNKQNIRAEIKIASGHSSKEEQLYNFIRLLHINGADSGIVLLGGIKRQFRVLPS